MSLLQELKNVDKEIEDVTVTAPKIKTGTLKQALKNTLIMSLWKFIKINTWISFIWKI